MGQPNKFKQSQKISAGIKQVKADQAHEKIILKTELLKKL